MILLEVLLRWFSTPLMPSILSCISCGSDAILFDTWECNKINYLLNNNWFFFLCLHKQFNAKWIPYTCFFFQLYRIFTLDLYFMNTFLLNKWDNNHAKWLFFAFWNIINWILKVWTTKSLNMGKLLRKKQI